jgi:hypothetical protein
MARDDRLRDIECIQQADHVAYEVQQRVLIDRFRCLAIAIAAHVRRDRTKSCVGERRQLVAPGIPGLRKAMAKDDWWPIALLRDMQVDAVGLDCPMRDAAHRCLPPPANPQDGS